MAIRKGAVTAVFRRNFVAYFSSPTGYVFITIFLAATAWLAFDSATFFANNLVDFSALNAVFHWLLVIFVPAITMPAWAEERKLGTDELLLTLPVHDTEVVLGKYLAALGVYTVSLFFALGHALVLTYLGNPDWGLIAANFLGYWFMGAALIPLGLVASYLTANLTVAFILGTVFCLVAVFAEDAAGLILGTGSRLAQGIGVEAHFRNFTLGVVALPDLVYFVLLACAALYVNAILLGRRHWRGGRHGRDMWWHYLVRGASVVAAAVSISVLAGRWAPSRRADLTVERLNSVSPLTVRLLKNLPGDQPVYIQAYVSPGVPERYVKTRAELLRLLRQISALGGPRVSVTVKDTEPYSDAAREAQDRFDITPQKVMETSEGRVGTADIFLGVAFASGPNQEVIPFLERGLSVEYELVRSMRVVAAGTKTRIGFLRTDANLFGGFDFQTMNMTPAWPIVDELRKQYQVEEVAPEQPVDTEVRVVVAPLPSSLTQAQMHSLAAQIRKGVPTLLLDDPLPISFPQLAPTLPRRPAGGMMGDQQPPEPKGDIAGMLAGLGVDWPPGQVVWDAYNPLTKVKELAQEIVFVCPEAGGPHPFGEGEVIGAGLSRVVLMFPGHLRKAPGTSLEFHPLLRSGATGGTLDFRQVISMGFMGMNINPRRPHVRGAGDYLLAARIAGTPPPAAGGAARPIKLIVAADLDFIGPEFFQLRKEGSRELEFDNITFFLNCVDYLAGDESVIALRNRRPRYRTLTAIETRRAVFEDRMLKEEKDADAQADEELDAAQKRLDEKLDALRKRTDVDERTKEIMLDNLQRVEQNKLDAAKAAIEARKDERTQRAREEMFRGVRRIENRVRFWTLVLPPLPALLIAVCMFAAQKLRGWAESSTNRAG